MNDTKKKNCSKTRTVKRYCPKCGFKINGEKHEEGEHHKKGRVK